MIATEHTIQYEAALAEHERRARLRRRFPLAHVVIEAIDEGTQDGTPGTPLKRWEDVWRVCDHFAANLIPNSRRPDGSLPRVRREADQNYGVHGRANTVCPWCGSTEIGPRLCGSCRSPHLIGVTL